MASGGGKRRAEQPAPPPRQDPKRAARKARPAQTQTPSPIEAPYTPVGSAKPAVARKPLANPRQLRLLWLVGVFGGAALIAVLKLIEVVPDWAPRSIAVIVGALLAIGLAIRSSGRWRLALTLSGALGLAGLVIPSDMVRAGCAVGAAASAASLGVLATHPASRYLMAIREVAVALAIAGAGSLAALGFASNLDHLRFSYVVLALALGGSVAMVYQLGAGLHGLGHRGYLMVAGALVLLTFALAYTAALRQWGSAEINTTVADTQAFIKSIIYASPSPVVALVGVPALAWGSFMRARRRQGWWVTAFGAAATAPMTLVALDRSLPWQQSLVSIGYSVLIGLALGYLLVRVEQFLDTGATSKRARRAEEHQAHRPEPGRMSPLH